MKNFKILIEVEVNDDGEVRSHHRPLSSDDIQIMTSLPSGGLVQVSHAMTIEALRREAYMMAISLMSSGTNLEDIKVSDVDKLLKTQLLETSNRFSEQAVKEILGMLRPQASPTDPAST